MKRKPTFADYGRLGGLKGGKSTSDAKVAAARKNGQKGGWPKGKRRKGKKRSGLQVGKPVAARRAVAKSVRPFRMSHFNDETLE